MTKAKKPKYGGGRKKLIRKTSTTRAPKKANKKSKNAPAGRTHKVWPHNAHISWPYRPNYESKRMTPAYSDPRRPRPSGILFKAKKKKVKPRQAKKKTKKREAKPYASSRKRERELETLSKGLDEITMVSRNPVLGRRTLHHYGVNPTTTSNWLSQYY